MAMLRRVSLKSFGGIVVVALTICAHLLTSEARKQSVQGEKGTCELGSLSDLTSNAILDRGAVVGLWEYDPDTSSIAWHSFGRADKALNEAVSRTEAYIREQLGDARSFSLDSPKSRVPRINAIRAAQKKQR